MRKRRGSWFIVAALCCGMRAGCGQSADSGNAGVQETGAAQENGTAAGTEAETGANSAESAENGTADLSNQEPYTVRIVAGGTGTDEACEEIAAAVSEITKAKFNTEVEIVRYDFSTNQEQVQTALASGEKIDLLGGLSWLTIPSAADEGQVLALNDLLDAYGQDILADIPEEDLASTSIEGQIYAIRNNKELGLGLGFACNTEMLESLGVDYSNVMTEEEMEPILQAVAEQYPDVYPLCSDTGNMGDYMYPIDWLGRDFGVLLDSFSEDTTVVNWYTSDEYYEQCQRRHRWVEEGLIMPDPSINTESANSLIGSGKAFCATTETKPGIEAQWERNTGIDMTVINIVPYYTMTSNLNNYWFIPYTSEQPERAMQVLNEMYSNPEVANLLIYGIEGEHYEFVDEENGVIDYPEGVTADDTGWMISAWHWPNELIAYKWVTDGADIWDETIQFNQDCHPSPAKGFVWDSSGVTNEIVACTTVLNKYKKGLDTGEVDPDTVFEQMKEEFEEAGIQKILEEKQSQLDAYMAQQAAE